MGRLSVRGVFLTLVVALVGFHLVSVTAAALPPNRYSEVVAPVNGYLSPYFAQNWRLFAPNPIDADRNMLFQASYRDAEGEIQQTEWIDWTAVELDGVHHKIVGRRGGYVTTKLIGSLATAHTRLATAQRDALTELGSADAPLTWAELSKELNSRGKAPAVVKSYLRYERATIRLATSVVQSRYPDADIVAVRYNVRRNPVLRYSNRNAADEDEQRRKLTTSNIAGWRSPIHGLRAEQDVIADFDRRHR